MYDMAVQPCSLVMPSFPALSLGADVWIDWKAFNLNIANMSGLAAMDASEWLVIGKWIIEYRLDLALQKCISI